MKAYCPLFFVFCLALFQCHQLKEDTLPDTNNENPFSVQDANIVVALTNGQGLINLPGLFNNTIKSTEVEIVQTPERGTITTFDDSYLVYQPNVNETDFEDKVVLKALNGGNNEEEVEVRLMVRSTPPDYCLVADFNPTYLGTPLKYSVKKGESLEVDFTDLFCDFSGAPSGGVSTHPHPTQSNEYLNIHIRTSSAIFTLNAPEDFTGTQGIIYQLCYDYTGSCSSNWFVCNDYPKACRYFLYTLVEVEVVD